jgi:hypothetical protein
MVAAQAQDLMAEWCQERKRERMRWREPQLVSLLAAQILTCRCEVRYRNMTVGGYVKCDHTREAATLLDEAIEAGLLRRTKSGVTSDRKPKTPDNEDDGSAYEVLTKQEYAELRVEIEDNGAKRTATWTSPVLYEPRRTATPEDEQARRERRTEQARLRERAKQEMRRQQRTSRTPLRDHRDEVIQLVKSGSTVGQISKLYAVSRPAAREFVLAIKRSQQ